MHAFPPFFRVIRVLSPEIRWTNLHFGDTFSSMLPRIKLLFFALRFFFFSFWLIYVSVFMDLLKNGKTQKETVLVLQMWRKGGILTKNYLQSILFSVKYLSVFCTSTCLTTESTCCKSRTMKRFAGWSKSHCYVVYKY